jgi:transcriptional regulator with XRE-family HTH domain
MTRRTPPDFRLAQAMKMLRYRKGLSLKEIEPDVGVSRQAINRWENGTAKFPEDRLPLYLKAVGATQDDLARELQMLDEIEEDGRDIVLPQPAVADPLAGLEKLEIIDESMSPWAEPGEAVLYQRNRHPLRFQGCVLELKGKAPIVRLYEREKDGFVFVRTLNPDATEQYPYSEVTGRHRVIYRGG